MVFVYCLSAKIRFEYVVILPISLSLHSLTSFLLFFLNIDAMQAYCYPRLPIKGAEHQCNSSQRNLATKNVSGQEWPSH